MSPAPAADPDALELAKFVLRYRRLLNINLRHTAARISAHARDYLQRHGVRYFLGTTPTGETSITCSRCGMTSHNPVDIANRYCGNCHVFHEDQRS